jgi:hypothetical protein
MGRYRIRGWLKGKGKGIKVTEIKVTEIKVTGRCPVPRQRDK